MFPHFMPPLVIYLIIVGYSINIVGRLGRIVAGAFRRFRVVDDYNTVHRPPVRYQGFFGIGIVPGTITSIDYSYDVSVPCSGYQDPFTFFRLVWIKIWLLFFTHGSFNLPPSQTVEPVGHYRF